MVSLASAGLAIWLSYDAARPNQVMTIMMLAIAAMATIFALIAALIKTPSASNILLGFSGVLLAIGAGSGLLLGAFSQEHLPTLFIVQWVIVAILMAVLSRTIGLVLAAVTLLPLGWMFWQSHDMTTADIALYLAIALVPLAIGILLPRVEKPSVHNPDAAPAPSKLARPAKPANSSTSAIVNAMSEGVISLNREGVIVLINPAAEKISGWSRQDALNLNYKSVLTLVDKTFKQIPDSENPIVLAMNSNTAIDSRKFLLETKSEKRINLSIIVTPIDDANGGIIVVFRDITSELAEESAQTEFISTASHEMRTPVASIEGYLGLALNPNTAQIDDKAREFITKAHESAEHLGQLFQDLLDITKADDGMLQNNPEPINLAAFTGDVVEGLRHKAEEKSLNLEFTPSKHALDTGAKAAKSGRRVDPTYYVRVDKSHLREIIANLTENAIKYTLDGGIKIDISGDSQHVVLSFADTGIGIPSEDVEHLFQKFYRVDNSDTREIGGTGLGLYLVRKLVDTMGGRIWVESEYGKGSTFFVQLDRLDSITAKQQLSTLAISKANEQAVRTPIATPPTPVRSQENTAQPTVTAPQAAPQPQSQPQPADTTPVEQPQAPSQSPAQAAPTPPAPAQPQIATQPAQPQPDYPQATQMQSPQPQPQSVRQQPAAPAMTRQFSQPAAVVPPRVAQIPPRPAQQQPSSPIQPQPQQQPAQPVAKIPQAPVQQAPQPQPVQQPPVAQAVSQAPQPAAVKRVGAVDYRPPTANPAPNQPPNRPK